MLQLHLPRHQHGADLQELAGLSRRTRLNTSRPCCCQSSARSSRKRLLNALRVASGEPPGFPENEIASLQGLPGYPISRGRPREKGIDLDRGLAFPGASWGTLEGTPLMIISK